MLLIYNPLCYRTSSVTGCRHRPVASRMHRLYVAKSDQPSSEEDLMEIAIAIGGLAAVFAGLGALILFTPYDK